MGRKGRRDVFALTTRISHLVGLLDLLENQLSRRPWAFTLKAISIFVRYDAVLRGIARSQWNTDKHRGRSGETRRRDRVGVVLRARTRETLTGPGTGGGGRVRTAHTDTPDPHGTRTARSRTSTRNGATSF